MYSPVAKLPQPAIKLYVFFGTYLCILILLLLISIPEPGGFNRYLIYSALLFLAAGTGVVAWATVSKPKFQELQINVLQTLFGKGWLHAATVIAVAFLISIVIFCVPRSGVGIFELKLVRHSLYAVAGLFALICYLGIAFYTDSLSVQERAAWNYWLRAFVVAGVPILVTSLLVGVLFHATLLEYMPFNSDEMLYWHQAKTYSAVGFNGGYYTYYERPAQASFSHFGPHGPVYMMAYGGIGAVIGWGYNTAVVLNHVFILVAVLLFIRFTALEQSNLKYLAVLLAVFSPLTLYSGVSMFEAFQYSTGIVLVALVYSMASTLKAPPIRVVASLALLFVMCLGRINWATLFPVVVYVAQPCVRPKKRLLLSLLVGFLFGIFGYLGWSWLAAPYGEASVTSSGWTGMYIEILSHWRSYLNEALSWQIKALTNYQAPIVLGMNIIIILAVYRLLSETSSDKRFIYWFHLYSLVTMLILGTVFGLGLLTFGYRHFAPFVLISCFLLIVHNEQRILSLILMTFLLFLPAFLPAYSSYLASNYNLAYESSEFIEFKHTVEEYLIYEPNQNAWCNSLLVEEDPQPFLSVPAGIGIAAKFEDSFTERYSLPLRSKYVLLDRPLAGANLMPIADTQYGRIYLNLDSDCFD